MKKKKIFKTKKKKIDQFKIGTTQKKTQLYLKKKKKKKKPLTI